MKYVIVTFLKSMIFINKRYDHNINIQIYKSNHNHNLLHIKDARTDSTI